jgi:hypothetical protein
MTEPEGFLAFDMNVLINRLLDSIVKSCVDSMNPKTDVDRLRIQAQFYDGIAEAARAKAEVARTFANEIKESGTTATPS